VSNFHGVGVAETFAVAVAVAVAFAVAIGDTLALAVGVADGNGVTESVGTASCIIVNVIVYVTTFPPTSSPMWKLVVFPSVSEATLVTTLSPRASIAPQISGPHAHTKIPAAISPHRIFIA
jgi:hypothetical protein